MNANEIQDRLRTNIGKKVTIENEEYGDSTGGKIHFNFSGTLEHFGDGEYYVRVGEDYIAGTMGVSFWIQNISTLEKRVYGELRIILK
jgi:hypothetical protein